MLFHWLDSIPQWAQTRPCLSSYYLQEKELIRLARKICTYLKLFEDLLDKLANITKISGDGLNSKCF